MKRLWAVAVAVVALAGACGGGDGDGGGGSGAADSVPTTAAVDEKGAVLAAWEAYRSAILAKNGPAAASAVSGATLEEYKTTLDRAMTMDKAALEREDVMEIALVLAVRLQFSAAELEGLDGRRFFELGVNEGLIAETTVKDLVFDSATVDGDEARLGTSKAGQAARGMLMRKEAGAWKVDLARYMESVGAQFNRMAGQEGMSRLDAALKMLGLTPASAEAERVFTPLEG